MRYDADAIEALTQGNVPSCHTVVGLEAIFHEFSPSADQICVGYELWCDNTPGYSTPAVLNLEVE